MLEEYLNDSIIIEDNIINKKDTINRLLNNIELAFYVLHKEKPEFPSEQWKNDNLIPFAQGNKKLPKTTYIINLGCSSLCPGRALGTCKHCNICYAHKAEAQYKESTLAYRLLQTLRWKSLSAKEIAEQLLTVSENATKNKMKYLRLNESGDVFDKDDIKKMSTIAKLLAKEDIGTYTYTSRNDLKWNKKSKHLVVNGSDFMVDNQFQICNNHNKNMIYQCHANCSECDYCKNKKNIVIYVEKH